jgi:hypothetical protein
VLGQVISALIAVFNVLFTSLVVRGNSVIYCTYENNDCTDNCTDTNSNYVTNTGVLARELYVCVRRGEWCVFVSRQKNVVILAGTAYNHFKLTVKGRINCSSLCLLINFYKGFQSKMSLVILRNRCALGEL